MRTFLSHITLAASLALLISACGDDDPAGPGDETDVEVRDNVFDPATLTVPAGQEVVWEWNGNNPHNVTWVAGGVPNSSTQTSGTYSRTFTQAGSFEYYCTVHGTPTSGMRGSVTVQ